MASTSNATLNTTSHSTPLDRLSEEADVTASIDHPRVEATSVSEIDELELQYPDEENDSNTLAPLQYPIETSRASPAGACICIHNGSITQCPQLVQSGCLLSPRSICRSHSPDPPLLFSLISRKELQRGVFLLPAIQLRSHTSAHAERL